MSINFVNQTSFVTRDEFTVVTQDIYNQLGNEFARAWGTSAVNATITVLDYPDENDPPNPGLGYHDVLPDGTPYGRVFAALARDNNVPYSIVLSHETMELMADPRAISCMWLPDGSGRKGWLVIAEVCDAVEMQSYKGVKGALLSNFVYPTWFFPTYKGQVDHMHLLPGPLRIPDGGYISANYIMYSSGWQSLGAFLLEATKKGKLSENFSRKFFG